MKDSSKVADLLSNAASIKERDNLIWLCSTTTLMRNLQKFHFPKCLDKDGRLQVLQIVGNDLMNNSGLIAPQLFKVEECTAHEKELIFEHFLSTHPYVHPQPGEGFVLDKSGEFVAVINQENHLELTNLSYGDELEKSFEGLLKVELELGKVLEYAFSPTFGFLTANPALCGTGLVARVFLHIPAILQLGLLESIMEKHKTEFVQLQGLTGSNEDFVGNIVVVSNTHTLGVSEETILAEVRTLATHLLVEEKGQQAKLASTSHPDIKDRISRAYGLLKHAYEIETFEALNALSLLKLGLGPKWIGGITPGRLNELFFKCRRAHLLSSLGEEVAQEELSHRRAQFLQRGTEELTLSL